MFEELLYLPSLGLLGLFGSMFIAERIAQRISDRRKRKEK